MNTWPSIKEPSTCSNAKASKTDREGQFIMRNLAQASRNMGGTFLLGGGPILLKKGVRWDQFFVNKIGPGDRF